VTTSRTTCCRSDTLGYIMSSSHKGADVDALVRDGWLVREDEKLGLGVRSIAELPADVPCRVQCAVCMLPVIGPVSMCACVCVCVCVCVCACVCVHVCV
jgi:hypothetical protein